MSDYIALYIEAIDRGKIDINFRIVNFFNKNIIVDHMEVEYGKICSRNFPEQSNHLTAKGNAHKNSIGHGHFSISLHSADIREIVRGITPANNTKSTPPDNRFEMKGVCVFEYNGNNVKIPFEINGYFSILNIPQQVIENLDKK